MNREPSFEQTVTDWLDEGADRAPERFVWAAMEDVERTAQRGAWVASTEEFLMQFKRAAPLLGIAVAAVLAIVAYQAFGSPNVGDSAPTPRAYTTEHLETILLTEEKAASEDMTVEYENRVTGVSALVTPLRAGGEQIDQTGFIDALNVELGTMEGGFTTWSALFASPDDAARAFEFIALEHDSPEGWGLAEARTDPGIGDESAMWTGQQYDMQHAQTIFWRKNNLLLAAVGWADWDEDEVRAIAEGMDDRAN